MPVANLKYLQVLMTTIPVYFFGRILPMAVFGCLWQFQYNTWDTLKMLVKSQKQVCGTIFYVTGTNRCHIQTTETQQIHMHPAHLIKHTLNSEKYKVPIPCIKLSSMVTKVCIPIIRHITDWNLSETSATHPRIPQHRSDIWEIYSGPGPMNPQWYSK